MKIELLIKPGHSLYRLNVETMEITEVDRNPGYRFVVDDYVVGSLYASALNLTNAQKKFNKMIDYIIKNHSNDNISNQA